MFQKPFRVKSNSSVKGSDRKKIRLHLEQHYGNLSPDQLQDLVPNKADISQMKIFTHSGLSVIVYVLDANPIFFELENQVFPTVYTLSKYPYLLPSLPTWPPVFEKLLSGADLMQPGVVLRGDCSKYERLSVNDLVSVRLVGNMTPVAVGVSVIGAEKLFSDDRKGKAVRIIHTFGDQLWLTGVKGELPFVPDEMIADCENDSDTDQEHEKSDCSPDEVACDSGALNEVEKDVNEAADELEKVDVSQEARSESELMDEVLTNSFLYAMKYRMKRVELPLLTSTFYSAYILPSCAPGRTLDVKKSSYKKFSHFLKEMQGQGILEVKELSKGVESIVALNCEHVAVRCFKPAEKIVDEVPQEKEKEAYVAPEIEDLFVVGAAVMPFFKTKRIGKGSAFSATEVRKLIQEYVKEQNLSSQRQVTLDPILAEVLLNKGEYAERLTWEDTNSRLLSRMQPAHKISFPGQEPVVKKGQVQPVEIAVAQRTGNKKVTLVYNLETYGIDPDTFAHQVQVGVAASTSVGPAQAKKGTQVLVQGNQVIFISKLLLDKYQLPRKFVIGLDKIPAKKKR